MCEEKGRRIRKIIQILLRFPKFGTNFLPLIWISMQFELQLQTICEHNETRRGLWEKRFNAEKKKRDINKRDLRQCGRDAFDKKWHQNDERSLGQKVE